MATSSRGLTMFPIITLFVSAVICSVGGQYDCPAVCTCDNALRKVSCADASISHVTFKIPHSVEILDLHGNQLQEISDSVFANLTALEVIDLSRNSLVKLSNNSFSGLKRLRLIDLRGNALDDSQLAALESLPSIQELYLGGNNITQIPSELRKSSITTLDLSNNYITSLSLPVFTGLTDLQLVNLTDDQILNFATLNSLVALDLSNNLLSHIGADTFRAFPNVRELHLEHNNLDLWDPAWFAGLPNLEELWLDGNPIQSVPSGSFVNTTQLQKLHLAHMPELMYVNHNALDGLSNLEVLNVSHNAKLQYLHAEVFHGLESLQQLDLSYNSLRTIHVNTFLNLTSLVSVSLVANPWSCDCDLKWLYMWLHSNDTRSHIFVDADFNCSEPDHMQGQLLTKIPIYNYSCSGATILNYTLKAHFKIGMSAILDCVAYGDPRPIITWITPERKVLIHHPSYIHMDKPNPNDAAYHTEHEWHDTKDYFRNLAHDQRIYLLKNGSLYIDYTTRKDAGNYTCIAHNYKGNETIVINFELDYTVILETFVMSIICGFSSAVLFFLFGLVIGALRYIAVKCSRVQRQKRKSIREVIENIDTYKNVQFGKFSAYKTAKIDQLSAFKAAKVDKLRSYKRVTVTTLVQYLHRLREHYSSQVIRIKDNCRQQAEKLHCNYSTHMGKFKDYRSHQIEKIRDNYSNQVLKIRDYGSVQMERLREQYKLQQQHVLKIMELLDIGNCMTVIEAECMRTESMLFDPDLNLDLDTHPVHVPKPCDSSESDSEYLTAATQSDTNSGINQPGGVGRSDAPPVPSTSHDPRSAPSKHNKPHKRQKHFKLHKHRPSQDSNSDLDEGPIHMRRIKHQKCPAVNEDTSYYACAEDSSVEDITVGIPTESHVHYSMDSDPNERHKAVSDTNMSPTRDMSPGRESVGTTDTTSHQGTEYESAQQSRDQTPESEGTSPSFVSVTDPASPTSSDGHDHIIVIDPNDGSLSEQVSTV